MNWISVLQGIGIFIGVMVAAGAGFGGFWYAFRSKEHKLLKEEIQETREAVERCESKHAESEKSVSNLQGQIDVLKKVPLAEIAKDMRELTLSNAEILETLRKSAVIAATDREVLSGSTHVKEQHVEHQHVESETVGKKDS